MPDTWPEDELPPPPTRTAAPHLPTLPPPPAIDGYEVGELVGRGGMAVVYRARQRSLNRPVALKVLLVGPYADPAERARIRAEAEAIARLQHPNVVHVYEVGEGDGLPYLLMEFVDGGTLADRLRAGPVSPQQAAEWAEAIARGVHAAHRRGIVHRDLKPANVLMTADGVPKISDFGIARRLDDPADRTRTGLVLGTPQYMAPEQAGGKKGVGPPADIWAVGVILYELLAGRPPFEGESSLELMRKVESGTLTPPGRIRRGIPPALEAICLKCLKKDPADRYPTAEALANDLARARSEVTRPGPGDRLVTRRRLGALVALLALAVPLTLVLAQHAGRPGPNGGPPNAGGPPGPGTAPVASTLPPDWAGLAPDLTDAGVPRWERFQIAAGDDTFDRIAFPTREVGYAASRKGVYRTDNGGQTWRHTWPQELPRGAFFLRFEDPQHGWLGAEQLFLTADEGATWKPVALPGLDGPAEVRALAIGPGGRALVGGRTASGEPTLFRRQSRTGGWEKLDADKAGLWGGKDQPYRTWILADLAVAGPGDGWAVLTSATEAGVLLHTADGGDHWEVAFQPRPESDLWHLHFADVQRGWVAGSGGKLWATTDGGHTWRPQENPAGQESVSCLAFARSGEPFALAPVGKGRFLRTTDGNSWEADEIGLKEFLDELTPSAAVVDSGRAYVLSRSGQVARYTGPRAKRP
jgi:photosystem II stability/assembly factor-like uncharacterized protein